MTTTTTAPQVTPEQRAEILRQLGRMNRMSIDGLRPATATWRGVSLTCGNGYRVEIDLDPSDTYTVRRVFVRGASRWIKGEVAGVYNVELPEVAYRAGMFRDSWPAGGIA